MDKILQALHATNMLLARSQDPAMIDIQKQLQHAANGHAVQGGNIGRIIAANYLQPENEEIQDWADLVMEAWQLIKGKS